MANKNSKINDATGTDGSGSGYSFADIFFAKPVWDLNNHINGSYKGGMAASDKCWQSIQSRMDECEKHLLASDETSS